VDNNEDASMKMTLSAQAMRVLGCLLEKQATAILTQ